MSSQGHDSTSATTEVVGARMHGRLGEAACRAGGATRRRRRAGVVGAAVLACAVLAAAATVPARADDGPVHGGCKADPATFDPACVPGTVDALLAPAPTYPDLVPDVPFAYIDYSFVNFDFETSTYTFGPKSIFFSTWAQNLGTVALDLVADDPSTPTASTVSQCVVWQPDHVCRERQQVGGFTWHDEHAHFHFRDFARYELRRVRRNGVVDYTRRGVLAVSDKVSFCMIDSTRVREDAFPLPAYTGFCNPFRQGISPGYADIYAEGIPGQSLNIEGLKDGRYAIVVYLNPARALHDADHDNDVVEAIVDISGGLSTVTIVERRWP